MLKPLRGPSATAALCLSLAALATASPALADTCSDTIVTARGEPASYRWLALVKARGNWRSQVRILPDLGAPYANFGRAADQVERCISDQRSVVCTVSARPCRP